MKYMGSKTALLGGRLGDILLTEATAADRFVDLFAGSGAVASFVAQQVATPVLSVDLQEYARVLASAIIERTVSLAEDRALVSWAKASGAPRPPDGDEGPLTSAIVEQARAEANSPEAGFITRHYGGHYFSLSQARLLDHLYRTLPVVEPSRTVALAALLKTASVCAAAPGHTAQPFQPTESLLPYIEHAWSRDVRSLAVAAVEQLAPRHARCRGSAVVQDAESTAKTLGEGDLVFCDPPYSAAQYSRFYHVLEGIARGGWDDVSGKGRAPVRSSRSTSSFSMKSKASTAMKDLLKTLRANGCRVVITFPDANASNGLSAQEIMRMAADDWMVEVDYLKSIHSTLGGSNSAGSRGGRRQLDEAVLTLAPRSTMIDVPGDLPLLPTPLHREDQPSPLSA